MLKRSCVAAIALSILRASHTCGQSGGTDLAQVYQQGMAAFAAGDYATAAADLETLVGKAEFSPQLEPAFYTVGSAYFNAGNYPKALAAFKAYQAKFPNGPHASDVAFGMAQASLLGKDYGNAAAQFEALQKDPRLRDQALFFSATASKEAGKIDNAIAALEKLTSGDLSSATAVRGAMMLAQLYVQKGDAGKVISLITRLHARIVLVDDIVGLTSTTVQLGDELFKKHAFAEALECYRAAYPREQIIKMQTERIAAMQKKLEENLNAARADPSQIATLGGQNNQLKIDIERTRQSLEEFAKLPSITPGIYLRLGRCFYEVDKKWESALVYREVVDRFQNIPEREPALFGLIVALADIEQAKKAEDRCEQYLREFKAGPNADMVGYLLGVVALQANDAPAAETYFGRMLETQGGSAYRDQMRYLLGNARFMQGKWDEAVADYKKYLHEYPKGQNVEDVNYRLALTNVFSGKYQEALNSLQDYLKKYPRGQYVSDAKYRIAVCKYAASLYDEVIKDGKDWEREFSGDKQLGEMLALMADAYAATDRNSEAVDLYVRSYKTATTDEVMSYSLFAASKILQKRGEWDRVAQLFGEFIQEKPDSPALVSAIYWIGKAKAREGKIDEAKKICAETIGKYINDPKREAVELLLTQIAQLCVKKEKPAEGDERSTSASEQDAGAELERLLGKSAQEESATAKARILFAKAELARLRKQPAEEQKNIAALAGFKPEDLSPQLLGRTGDYLLGEKKFEAAAKFYQQLLDEYPKSDNLDFAYAGLGEIARQKNDLRSAERYFSDGTDKIVAQQKLKELTLGKAKTLFDLGRLEEAKKAFELVASVREWRGEATAFSVYSLGEIEAKRGHWAEANAYFQRVYVAYGKFLPWVAKAYLRSAECFEKLNKRQEAANTYREMLRNEKLASFAEADEARKKLEAMGQQG